MMLEGCEAVACGAVWPESNTEKGAASFTPDDTFEVRTNRIQLKGIAYLASAEGFDHLEALRVGVYRISAGQRILVDGPDTLAMVVPSSTCRLRLASYGIEITFNGQKGAATIHMQKKHGRTVYTSPDILSLFDCISHICSDHDVSSPNKSNPLFRGAPPSIHVLEESERMDAEKREFAFHLPADLRYLYAAAPIAYYLGASIEIDDRPQISFPGHPAINLPFLKDFEAYAGEALRRTFYMDCAIRYATSTGCDLPGVDTYNLFGYHAHDIFNMAMEERFLLYAEAGPRIKCPAWHMASYLDPSPWSIEAMPFLLRTLSAIYSAEGRVVSEREVVSSAVKDFLGQGSVASEMSADGGRRSIIMPLLHRASSHYWFSRGYPVDAVKASASAFGHRQRFAMAKGRKPVVAIICNEKEMESEVRDIANELSHTPCDIEVFWDASVDEFSGVFAAGHSIVQFIGHCDSNGFRCSDGFARASDIIENHTPMFFFNSCSSHSEALRLIESGSVCGVATLFRVLEESAIDVCTNFYRMLGAGYSALTSLKAAKSCSVLGKEYLLLGDGSYACFGGPEAMPFFEILGCREGYSLRCTIDSLEKGSIVTSWHRANKKPATDLGFETREISSDHLLRIARELKGYCLYARHIYRSVGEAAKQLKKDEGSRACTGRTSRSPGS